MNTTKLEGHGAVAGQVERGVRPLVPKRDVVGLLRGLERHGEDSIWRTAQQAREEMEALRSQLAHWKAFAVHAEGEHAAWKKTAGELDDELHKLRAATAEGRTYTQADLMEAVKTERHACSICVWMVLQDALEPGADDKGLDGWMREAEQRVKNRLEGRQ